MTKQKGDCEILQRKFMKKAIDKLQLDENSTTKEKIYWFQAAQNVINLAFDVYKCNEILPICQKLLANISNRASKSVKYHDYFAA